MAECNSQLIQLNMFHNIK